MMPREQAFRLLDLVVALPLLGFRILFDALLLVSIAFGGLLERRRRDLVVGNPRFAGGFLHGGLDAFCLVVGPLIGGLCLKSSGFGLENERLVHGRARLQSRHGRQRRKQSRAQRTVAEEPSSLVLFRSANGLVNGLEIAVGRFGHEDLLFVNSSLTRRLNRFASQKFVKRALTSRLASRTVNGWI